MQITRITLQFPSRVFLDSHNSAKIARAILYGISQLYGQEEVENILKEQFATTDLLYWSFTENGNEVYFYPKLIYSKKISQQIPKSQYTRLKDYKKIQYVSQKILENYYEYMVSYLQGENTVKVEKSLAFLEEEKPAIIQKTVNKPYNSLPRIRGKQEENTAQEFYFILEEWITYGGLYFDIAYEKQSVIQKIIPAIRFLEDRGIGKKITSGLGNFEIKEIKNIQNNDFSKQSNTKLLLSHWIPSQKDVDNKITPKYYSLIKYQPIKQTIDSSNPTAAFPYKTIHMITSGSIITSNSEIPEIIGKSVDVSEENEPKNIVWGKAITIPIQEQ